VPSSRKSNDLGVPTTAPPTTPEEMETYLIGLAYKRTEKQILDGSVSPTTLNYFLRLGGTRAEVELERIRLENKLAEAKTSHLESQESQMHLLEDAKRHFSVYAGDAPPESLEEDWVDED
jgi:hypothetical protein